MEHNVVHGETAPGSWGDMQIMVMFRSDFFRDIRARKINARPGPEELFRIVNMMTARHLAEVPFPRPDIAAVIAECPREIAVSACEDSKALGSGSVLAPCREGDTAECPCEGD